MFRREKDHGTFLLDEFEAMLTSHRQRAEDRVPVVRARLEMLESEMTDLRALLARLEAAASS